MFEDPPTFLGKHGTKLFSLAFLVLFGAAFAYCSTLKVKKTEPWGGVPPKGETAEACATRCADYQQRCIDFLGGCTANPNGTMDCQQQTLKVGNMTVARQSQDTVSA